MTIVIDLHSLALHMRFKASGIMEMIEHWPTRYYHDASSHDVAVLLAENCWAQSCDACCINIWQRLFAAWWEQIILENALQNMGENAAWKITAARLRSLVRHWQV